MIKSGFKSIPQLDEKTTKYYKEVVELLKVSDVQYTQEHELIVTQLAKALTLQDVYESSILEHGVLIDNGKGQLKTNPASVSLASCKANINALIVQLMLSPKSQGLSVVVPEPVDEDEEYLKELLRGDWN